MPTDPVLTMMIFQSFWLVQSWKRDVFLPIFLQKMCSALLKTPWDTASVCLGVPWREHRTHCSRVFLQEAGGGGSEACHGTLQLQGKAEVFHGQELLPKWLDEGKKGWRGMRERPFLYFPSSEGSSPRPCRWFGDAMVLSNTAIAFSLRQQFLEKHLNGITKLCLKWSKVQKNARMAWHFRS